MHRDFELESGLRRLKYAFALYAITIAVSWIPLVGTVGGLLGLISIILLIMGWRALGRSNLQGSNSYHSTSNILIITVVLAFVVIFVGIIATVVSFFESIAPGSIPTNPTNPFAIPGFESLLTTFLIIVAIGLVIAFLGQLKSALSMRQLSKEISEPRIGAAANLLILTYAVGGVSFAVLVSILPGLISSLSLASSGVPNQTALLGDLFTGSLILAGLLYAAEIVLFLIACTLGYLGLNAASSKLESLKFSTTSSIYPPPPPTNPSMTEGVRYCASCGSKVQSGASFCTNCGAKV